MGNELPGDASSGFAGAAFADLDDGLDALIVEDAEVNFVVVEAVADELGGLAFRKPLAQNHPRI
ncbi:hypothetical protein KEJ47_10535 [Candidatus Bathyarchaeota archaeon]|nr:hypothetical protein [Candidatus Bathyarchaeota archaeon]